MLPVIHIIHVNKNKVNEDDEHDGDSAQVRNDMPSTSAEGPMDNKGDKKIPTLMSTWRKLLTL